MNVNRIIGIDPGVNGALVEMTTQGDLIQIHDMPTLEDGAKGRRTINAPLLASIIYKSQATKAFCELVGPRPTDGNVGAFGFGRCRGIIEGVLAACGVPVVMIAPPVWKRAAGIAPGKENKDSARAKAIARWPAQAALFARKMDIDRAEACLIAVAGMMREECR
jgi:crossover junction endodeoxyribonuclease RuvC